MRAAAFVAVLLAVAGVVASEPALAHGRSHVSVGVGFGYGYWGPWGPWGPWGYPYYPPVQTIVVPAQPITYIEQPAAPALTATTTPTPDRWWYYCDSSRGYYPYVKECPAGWQRVAPAPSK